MTATRKALVVFSPSGKRGRFPVGTTVIDAAHTLGVDIDSVCGGRGLCGRCQVEVSEGRFAKHNLTSRADHLSAFSATEGRFRERRGLAEGRRLGCTARIEGDIVIDVPASSQVHKQIVRKRPEARNYELDPAIRLHYVEVLPPDMHNPMGDLERLQQALADQWGISGLECDLRTLQSLQPVLRDGDWKVTVAVHREQRITAIWPGFRDRAYGIAFDVGSTTIAGHLANLATGEVLASDGIMNPQIRFGEDLMSRISYIMMNPERAPELTRVVRTALTDLAGQLAEQAGVQKANILNVTIVGNPIMHHTVLGIDPRELGGAPFPLAANTGMTLWATEIELGVNPDARVYVLPCIAGHVGADTAAVLLSEAPHLTHEVTLIVDIGTNAELVLGNRDRLLAASSPTGPAFEGAQISAGQRAAPGAIERVRIDRETGAAKVRVIDCDLWSDEPGFEAAVGPGGVTGICGSGIIEAIAEMYLAGLLRPDGTIDGGRAASCPDLVQDGRTFRYVLHRGAQEISVTQNDVRAIQLAKAALYAGARLLMDHYGVDAPERIILAGAFGSHIDVTYAMVLGLIPDCDLDKVSSAGNAAGTGALIALLNQTTRDEIEELVRSIEKIETAVEPRFQEHFVDAMAIPHASAPFPNLASRIALPGSAAAGGERRAPGTSGRRGGRSGGRSGRRRAAT